MSLSTILKIEEAANNVKIVDYFKEAFSPEEKVSVIARFIGERWEKNNNDYLNLLLTDDEYLSNALGMIEEFEQDLHRKSVFKKFLKFEEEDMREAV
jgi:hypothetical protein